MQQVKNFAEYVKAGRENIKPDGFDFDMDQFENLIDCWTPMDQIPVILRTTYERLNVFCQICYGMDYKETYQVLSGVVDAYMRKTFKGLASQGNNSAISIVSKHFMKLEDDASAQAVNIKIFNDLDDGKIVAEAETGKESVDKGE